jgi:hypothetical protein
MGAHLAAPGVATPQMAHTPLMKNATAAQMADAVSYGVAS